MKQTNVPEEFKLEFDKLLKRNKDLFVSEDKGLERTDTLEMRIDTGRHEPMRRRPYCVPLKQRKMVDTSIDEMMRADVIERSNNNNSFLAEKKDGSKRVCVDFRALNKMIKKYVRALYY